MNHWILILLLPVGMLQANDGVYLSRGGVLYPTQETRIALTKEVLSFTCREGRCAVDVLFEFTNPEPTQRTLIVGFQAPSSVGDVPDSLCSKSQIRDLKVMVGDALLPFVQKAADCEECPLEDPSNFTFTGENPGVFVYLFGVSFKPGITRVHHSYTFPASRHVYFEQIYSYILRTGAKWASSSIEDLTVLIDLGPNSYFYVNDVFGPAADWTVVGAGKVTSTTFDRGEGTNTRMVRINSGRLMISVSNLHPEENIEFGVVTVGSFFNVPTESSGLSKQVATALRFRTTEVEGFGLPALSDDDLRLMRNLLYARYGYTFKDTSLQQRMENYAWYISDPNLRAEDVILSSEDNRLLAEIIRREKE